MAETLRKLRKSFSIKLSFHASSSCPRSSRSGSPRSSGFHRSHSSLSGSGSGSGSGSSSRISRSFSFQPSNKSSKKTCAICLGSLRTGQGLAIFTAECSHSFHFNCITSNVQHGNRVCPICRCEWKDIPFHAPVHVIDNNRRHGHGNRARVNPQSAATPVQLPSDRDHFADDEPLPVNSIGPATSPSPAQALTVKAFPEYPAVSATDSPAKFAVLVHIRAPSLLSDANHLDRAPIDLVTVLDVSASMSSKLTLLKRAVHFIVQNLGPADRLSIVVFSSVARRIFPLQRMTDCGREDAFRAINSLTSNGGTNIVEGLKKGVRVLEDRRERNPVASIILLSDGQDTYNVRRHNDCVRDNTSSYEVEYLNLLPSLICPQNSEPGGESQQQTIPVHTFGFGLEHDSTAMHGIADASGGTFSFIESISILQDAFARCIGGLLSVVAQDVQLKISSISAGVRIESVPSGKYKSDILMEGQQAIIDIGELYADEEKEFLVYISIPKSSSKSLESTPLLDVFCMHKDSTSMEIREVKGERIEIRRPKVLSTADKEVSLEVDRQRSRLLVAETIADAQRMAEMGQLEGAQALLTERRSILLASASAQAGDGLCNWLETELREIRERMANMELYERTGRAYILSGLSSHSWQRATTRGDNTRTFSMSSGRGDETTSYETPTMVTMVSRSQTLNFTQGGPQPSSSHNKSCRI
ncbi:E3 ubiquitin-protein ligase WAV3-like [Mangifera indica]|uniref:E3 ubiquitin-protein ligase WAV3-like n=1 Tax=Mangifera indica TaxID=29780 RepID=UPI001CF93769|nr:E3 ubiquitin-protein ligase WAV3-like [Mangifera indica]XP_044509192.1 E3 ubiquitin-protein ligase WAV3-like [Mangifera indica]XP_044509193.1 E3 ubiquitin-protein ligase WAV3-like [Mangifera indica]